MTYRLGPGHGNLKRDLNYEKIVLNNASSSENDNGCRLAWPTKQKHECISICACVFMPECICEAITHVDKNSSDLCLMNDLID